jgi:hypothetical protein
VLVVPWRSSLASLAVELVKAGQLEDAKGVVKTASELDPDLRLVMLDHPGLSSIWRDVLPLTCDKRNRPLASAGGCFVYWIGALSYFQLYQVRMPSFSA